MRSDTRLSALFDTLEAGPGFEQRGKVRGAIGTAIRFYFVSWLGERARNRDAADVRIGSQPVGAR